jgi:hypothetical protein
VNHALILVLAVIALAIAGALRVAYITHGVRNGRFE